MPAWRELIAGYRRFRSHAYPTDRARWSALADGQSPGAMLIGCSDSRVEPARIFDTAPGQLFVVRNVANLVPPFERGGGLHGVSAAIEFAVLHLQVRYIVVLGHARCGGVARALAGRADPARPPGFLDDWVALLEPARDAVLRAPAGDPQRALEYAAVMLGLANLRTFPWVAEREAAGRLALHGAHFGIGEGELRVLGADGETFRPV